VEPVVIPRHSFVCFGVAAAAGVRVNAVLLRSRTWVVSVTV